MSKLTSLLFLILLAAPALNAQIRSSEDAARDDLDYYGDEPDRASQEERFVDNLWFGGGIQLGFQGGNGISFFNVGLSPMVGYKVTPNVSFGPRVSVNYNAFRCEFNDVKSNYVTWEAGLFGRLKVFNQFFIHGEYSLENRRLIFQCAEPTKQIRSMPYLGVGYTSGFPGGMGSEILLLFRLRQDGQNIVESPYTIRAGLNFNF